MGTGQESEKKRWSRDEIAEEMEAFEQEYEGYPSQRHWAEELEIPRTPLQHWLERKANIDADPDAEKASEAEARHELQNRSEELYQIRVNTSFMRRLNLASCLCFEKGSNYPNFVRVKYLLNRGP